MKHHVVLWTLLSAAFLFLTSPINAQDYSHIRIVRLSFAEGTVQYQRPGEDWQDAGLNLPIQEGFALRTTNGYAEVEFEESLSLRLGTNSTVEFTQLALLNGARVTRFGVSQGTAYIDAKLRHGDAVVVSTPQGTLNLPRDARFRVDVVPSESWVSVFHGKVAVDSIGAGESQITGGHTLHERSDSTELAHNPPNDDFDKWVSRREDAVNSAKSATSDVLSLSSYTEGFADLYDYGLWSDIPGYGAGWVPYGVGTGWMPFVDGQWMFMGFTGWNWVSAEPWGWLPYHFGSWVNAPGIGWAWLPVGSRSWMPATASWVQIGNQLGWVPNGPSSILNPKKVPASAIPSAAVLAAQGTSGVIKAGSRMPLTQTGISLQVSPAPPPVFAAVGQSAARTTRVGQPAGGASFVQSAPAGFTRNSGAPLAVRAPGGAQVHATSLSSAPRAMMAPHSAPRPAFARGASSGGSLGGASGIAGAGRSGAAGGISGGSGASNTRGAASARTSGGGTASQGGASSGASGGAHH